MVTTTRSMRMGTENGVAARGRRLAGGRRVLGHGSGRALLGVAMAGALGAALATGVALGGVVPGRVAAATAAPITLRFSEYPRPAEDEMLKVLLPAFEKQTGIHVVYEPVTDATSMTTKMVAGTAPDVVCWWGEDLYFWGLQGMLVDLNPYIANGTIPASDLEDFAPGQIHGFRAAGRQYALPQYLGTVAMYYNRDAFDTAGLPELGQQTTWQSFLDVARKLTIRQDNKVTQWGFYLYYELDRVAYWVRQNGGQLYPGDDRTTCLLDQPAATEALQFWADLINKYHVAPHLAEFNLGLRDGFAQGKVATAADGSWSLAFMMPSVKFRLGIAELPAGPVARSTLANMDGYGVYSGTKHEKEAVELLKFLVSPLANQLRAEYQALQPARGSVAKQWADRLLEKYPNARGAQLMVFAASARYAAPGPIYADPKAAQALLNPAFSRIFEQGQSAEVVMKSVVPTLNARLRQAVAAKAGGQK
ncbi:MAG: sugar ABC transporter substrate-binding protein [Limnochordaceae bacterium]|nr:sugar ABC transporter substrate-binding protein [Limnochordaceae bacterium]